MKLPSITSTKADRANVAEDAFVTRYFDFQYCFVEFFVEHLGDLSRVFQSDLQQMLVLAVVGQAKLRAVQDAIEAGEDSAKAILIRKGINASRLADITSVPRQTVRRKLLQLRDRGWVEQYADGTWGIASREGGPWVRDAFGEVDHRAIGRVARLFADLEGIVDP